VGLHFKGQVPGLHELGLTGGTIAQRLFLANLLLVGFNLLPAFPMDGGRVLRALLATRLPFARATRIAARIGRGMAVLFGFVGLFSNPMLILIALFVWIGAGQEAGAAELKTSFDGVPVRAAMLTEFQTLDPRESLGDVARRMLAGAQQDFPVVDETGRVLGVVTHEAFLRALRERGDTASVAAAMVTGYARADAADLLDDVLSRVDSEGCSTLPVFQEGRLIGLLTAENVGEYVLIQTALAARRTERWTAPPPPAGRRCALAAAPDGVIGCLAARLARAAVLPISLLQTFLFLLAGVVALYFGADWLVRGSASLARRWGVTPLLVGLTVVAYGTSAPELIVSCFAAANNQGDIAIGNAVGSNLFNIGVILGITALICPLRVQWQLVKFDTPVMLGAALLFLVCFRDGQIQLWEAVLFLGLLAVYTVVNIRLARRQATAEIEQEFEASLPNAGGSAWKDTAFVVAGLLVLVVGSRLFVTGAVDLARLLKMSEAVIGLTIVAAGTSLPELAASLMAAVRRQPDMAIGNVVGSNIYNLLAILGTAGVIGAPLDGSGVGLVDTLAMVGISVVLLVIAWTGFQLRRWEGALLLALYGGYLWHLWPK
jgi:cation:H+ antiporter